MLYRCSPTNPFSVVSCVSARVMRGAEFYPGCRVLARSERDGLYYLGTIIHQVQKEKANQYHCNNNKMHHHLHYNVHAFP